MNVNIEVRTSDRVKQTQAQFLVNAPALVVVKIVVEGEETEVQIGIGADGRVAIRREDA